MKKNINNHNNKGEEHGYQEVNLKDIHTLGQEGTEVNFHIR